MIKHFLKFTPTIDTGSVAYSFTQPDTAVQRGNVQVHKCVESIVDEKGKPIWDEQPHHDDYANGYYPVAQARTFWNKLIERGYIPVEKL